MILIKKAKKIITKDGYMIPIFRDWDVELHEGHQPKMVYATTLNPRVKKDIILHKKRTSYLCCIDGIVELELLINGQIHRRVLDSASDEQDNIELVIIQPNVPFRLTNYSEDQVAILINCPSPAWHPDDEDTIKFVDWSQL